MKTRLLLGFLLLLTVNVYAQSGGNVGRPVSRLTLRENWKLQSSVTVNESGVLISTPQFRTTGWYPTRVPSTVLAALVESKVYPDPFFGINLKSIPACTYKSGANSANVSAVRASPFCGSWWYRTEFRLPAEYHGRRIALHFDGINYRANIWLNGRRIADFKEVAGTFRLYEFDITEVARLGALNTLAVEVFPPGPDDLALTWVDWNPTPPDRNMGLWHDVYVTTSGPVTITYPQVLTDLDLPSLETGHLTVSAELKNTSDRAQRGTLRGRIEGIQFSEPIRLVPNETRVVDFPPDKFRQLNISHPRLWWPADMGSQSLYRLELEFHIAGRVSDRQTTPFGIRKITSELDKENHRLFKVNGRNILIRGGGWAPDMLLRFNPQRIEQEFRYVKDMHLNTIRLEGKLESDYFYELADREGILVIAGWCCCDQWEHWEHREDYKEGPTWDEEDYLVAERSQEDQIRRLRNHPSLLAWMNGSDHAPPPRVEKMYLDVLEKYRWPNPYLSSASARFSEVTGTSGVKMEGPYEWAPPSYWLLDTKRGGAYGFATEISPGPAVPPIESLRRMLPRDHLWPIDDYWSFHCGRWKFSTVDVFTDALNARYGQAKSVEDYAAKSQLMAYEAQRAMFEAYGRNKYRSTGVIQWMLNNAWPSMIWHLYDYYLRPGGGYFGTKKACEPIHVQYSYDDRSVVVVNSTYQDLSRMRVKAKVFDLNAAEKYSYESLLSVPADAVSRAGVLPDIPGLTSSYFLKLILEDKSGKLISSNFYWLSTKGEVLDWEKSKGHYTPAISFADFTALEKLQPAKLVTAGYVERKGDEEVAHVSVENKSRSLAFAVHLQIERGRSKREVLPVLWEDNYFTLLPGEKRQLTARYGTKDLEGQRPVLAISGRNVEPESRALTARSRVSMSLN